MMLSSLHNFTPVSRLQPYRTYAVLICILVSIQFASAQADARNKKPKIEGQRELSVVEEEAIEITLGDVEVEDKDDWFYPWGFSLQVHEGEHYSYSGNTVTPEANFEGELSVRITVSDGKDESDVFHLRIAVIGVNDPPVITGQSSIVINEDEPLILQASHLIIHDPDNTDFEIAFSDGDSYIIENGQIIPARDFNGTLTVPVSISDGELLSDLFYLTIIIQPVNDAPTITAQQEALSTVASVAIAIGLQHLTVSDPDNTYPEGFTLRILEGQDYSVSGTSIIPSADFEGDMPVNVVVNDGSADSQPFELKIVVQKRDRAPIITGQQPVIINEDQAFTMTFSHLQVDDQDEIYPTGYSISVANGSNYTVSGLTITPLRDFSGNLFASTIVNDGKNPSEPFLFQITVRPVNDPPVIATTGSDSLIVTRGQESVSVFENVSITDVDNDSLSLAEIGFGNGYEGQHEVLQFTNTPAIKGFFDQKNGILALIGKASKVEYKKAIESVGVEIFEREDEREAIKKSLYLIVSDGQHNSNRISRDMYVRDPQRAIVDLRIPSGFTPNGDQVNDTWRIQSLPEKETFADATIRVYTKSGILVFEANGLAAEWDGRYNGTILPADVYYYTIDLKQPDEKNLLKGVVTILR